MSDAEICHEYRAALRAYHEAARRLLLARQAWVVARLALPPVVALNDDRPAADWPRRQWRGVTE